MKSMRSVAALALCSSLALGAVSMGTSVAFAADEMPDKSDQPVTDTWITTKVKTELAASKVSSLAKVHVDTDADGWVLLTGKVATQADKDKAESVAKAVDGVKSVDNQLVVTGK